LDQRFAPFFLAAPCGADLYQFRLWGLNTFDEHCDLGVVALRIEALVPLYVSEKLVVISGASGAVGACAFLGNENSVFEREGGFTQVEVEVVVNP
jgi:hypothetical protein